MIIRPEFDPVMEKEILRALRAAGSRPALVKAVRMARSLGLMAKLRPEDVAALELIFERGEHGRGNQRYWVVVHGKHWLAASSWSIDALWRHWRSGKELTVLAGENSIVPEIWPVRAVGFPGNMEPWFTEAPPTGEPTI